MKIVFLLVGMLVMAWPCYSQQANADKVKRTLHSFDSHGVTTSLWNYSIALGEVESREDDVDEAEFYSVGEMEGDDVFLFTIPSHRVHYDWGIGIKKEDSVELYSYGTALPFVIYTLLQRYPYAENLHELIHTIVSCAQDECFNTKQVNNGSDTYNYYISNWYHFYMEKNYTRHGFRDKKTCRQYAPTKLLNLRTVETCPEWDEKIKRWHTSTYGREDVAYYLYEVTSLQEKETIYLLRSNLSSEELCWCMLLHTPRQTVFYHMEDNFIPIVFCLTSLDGIPQSALRKALECACLINLYYYGDGTWRQEKIR